MPDEHKEQPSLEPPRLFGRTKRARAKPQAPAGRQAPVVERDAETQPLAAVAPAADASSGRDTLSFEDAARERPDGRDGTGGAAVGAAPGATGTTTIETSVEPTPQAGRPRRTRLPRPQGRSLLTGRSAALVTGLVVGLGLVGLVLLGFQGCEQLRGTSSCGTGPGLAFLTVIFVLGVLGGRLLLAVGQVPDPGSTSFLAVGLTAVIALLFFIDVLDSWAMLVVIPAISAGCFLLSWWVTTTYVDPTD